VERILVEDNSLSSDAVGIQVAGASIVDTNGHVVVGNAARDIRLRQNDFDANQRNCRVEDEHRERSVGFSSDNSAPAIAC